MSDYFEDALHFALLWEGGFVNDPHDLGGATNFGVTQRTYDARRRAQGLATRSVRFITEPEVSNIYRHMYWKAAGCDTLPKNLAIAVFDTAVNFGVGRAKEFLSKEGTAAGIVKQRRAYRLMRVAKNPTQVKFLKGWKNRDNALAKLVGV